MPSFTSSESGTNIDEFKVSLRNDCSLKIDGIKLHTPEKDNSITLEYLDNGSRIEIDVPRNSFRGYAVIEIVSTL